MEVVEGTPHHSAKPAGKIIVTKSRKRKGWHRRVSPSITNIQDERNSERFFNFDEINLAPMERMRTPNYSRCRKFLWGLVLIICATVCIWHFCNRVAHYLSKPTSFDISVDHQQQVQFPSITLCPQLSVDDDDGSKLVNLNNFWADTQMQEKIRVLASCIPADGICRNYSVTNGKFAFSIKNKTLSTIFGMCTVLQPDFLLEYRGLHTWLIIDLSKIDKNIAFHEKNRTSTFFIHSQGPLFRHDVFYLSKYLFYGYRTKLEITLKKFKYLSRETSPCMSEDAAVECRNKCIDKILEDNVRCSLPFMATSPLPQCNNSNDATDAFHDVIHFYGVFNLTRCNCRKACEEYIFTSHQSVEEDSSGNTVLILQYANNVVETVTEKGSYSFASLLSDVCASLGFVLGFCVYTFLELLECTCDVLFAHVMKTCKTRT